MLRPLPQGVSPRVPRAWARIPTQVRTMQLLQQVTQQCKCVFHDVECWQQHSFKCVSWGQPPHASCAGTGVPTQVRTVQTTTRSCGCVRPKVCTISPVMWVDMPGAHIPTQPNPTQVRITDVQSTTYQVSVPQGLPLSLSFAGAHIPTQVLSLMYRQQHAVTDVYAPRCTTACVKCVSMHWSIKTIGGTGEP